MCILGADPFFTASPMSVSHGPYAYVFCCGWMGPTLHSFSAVKRLLRGAVLGCGAGKDARASVKRAAGRVTERRQHASGTAAELRCPVGRSQLRERDRGVVRPVAAAHAVRVDGGADVDARTRRGRLQRLVLVWRGAGRNTV